MLASAATTDNGLARELSSARARLASQERQIRELNHRIANSLQLAANMLVFEQLRAHEPRAQAALEASRARLVAVAELHRYLYDHAERTTVELRPFLTGLCEALVATTGLKCSVESDQTSVPGDMAQQLAIAINEFAINAAKHAYDGSGGRLIISSRREAGELVLTVADEGRGLSAGPTSGRSGLGQGGLGMSIVAAIVRDLKGTLTVQSDRGATFTIRAPLALPAIAARSFHAWNLD
jgi:two-component sensor histidine kinase